MNKLVSKNVAIRCLSTSSVGKAVCWPRPDYGPMEVQRTVMMNGIRVAAAKPLGAQVAACTVMFQAGSRFEEDNQIGANHFARVSASASGCGYTAFSKMRFLQQHGASITSSSDRQSLCFTLRCPLTSFPELKYYLLDVAARCCYNQYELDDRMQLIKDDLVRIDPEQRVMDLIQQASWRGPLSNSIYCPEDRIDTMRENYMNCFARTNMRAPQCTIASIGVPFEETMNLAEKIDFKRERTPERCEMLSCPRTGFEMYDLGRCSDTWVALAVPGCGTCEITCLIKHAIVAAACGTGNMQSGQHELDRTPQPPLGCMAGGDIFTTHRAFNISYYDHGIFGILVKSPASTIRQAVVTAAQFLAQVGELSFKQIEIGKKRLKLALALHDEDSVRVVEGLALQLVNNVQIDSARNSIQMIDLLCPDEISCTAKALSTKRYLMSYAVVGDIGAVPHDTELVANL